MAPPVRIDAEYLLPLRWTDDAALPELLEYLGEVVSWMPVTVIDGSDAAVFEAHARALPTGIRHLRPEPWPGRNGKVAGVMTGVRHAGRDRLVLADDDVRYDRAGLERVVALLADADLVAPQNYFSPLPWHAAWDTARTLINRCFGADYPGTFAVRKSALERAGGYDGDVLFENLELMRTIAASGGRVVRANSLFVRRVPPSTRHFFAQRLRQAYDGFAQPGRLATELALLPALAWASRRPARLGAFALAACGVAAIGRLRDGGRAAFSRVPIAYAPIWILERALCAWLAVYQRMLGGVRYSGARMPVAGSSRRALSRKFSNER